MLGPERFASFETPNVIDLGDSPPVQPKRKQQPPSSSSEQQQEQASGQATAPSTPPRSSRAMLGRTEKIDLGGINYDEMRKSRLLDNIQDLDLEKANSYDSNENDNDDDNNPHSLPSIDEARNYAATLLQNANRRTSTRDLATEEPSNVTTSLPLMYTSSRHAAASGSKHLVRDQVLTMTAKVVGIVLVLVLVILALARLSM